MLWFALVGLVWCARGVLCCVVLCCVVLLDFFAVVWIDLIHCVVFGL